jgi:hypothetical protein
MPCISSSETPLLENGPPHFTAIYRKLTALYAMTSNLRFRSRHQST